MTQLIGAIVIVIYRIVAQRRVYAARGWRRAKAFGVTVIYGTMWSAAVLAVTVWAAGAP